MLRIIIDGVEQDCNGLADLYDYLGSMELTYDYVEIERSELSNGDPTLELSGHYDNSLDE